jgi:hypothetical protein
MEAAIRTAHYLITGEELEELKLQQLRGLTGVKEARSRRTAWSSASRWSAAWATPRLLDEIRAVATTCTSSR